MTSPSKSSRPWLRVVLLTFAALVIVALPTALWFGLGEAVFGGSGRSIGLTVLIFAVGLALIWVVQFLWESRKERKSGDRRGKDPTSPGRSGR